MLEMQLKDQHTGLAHALIQHSLDTFRKPPRFPESPLKEGFACFAEGLEELSQPEQNSVIPCLKASLYTEPDLNTRFLLRLLLDFAESLLNKRAHPYL